MKRWKKRLFIKLPLALIALSVLWVVALKYIPVRYTPLMFKRAAVYRHEENFHTVHPWVPIEEMSPNVIKAAIASEDNRFPEHNGFDTKELKIMYKAHVEKGKKIRGCSTISQQTAKNVFTFCGDNWWRKAVEAYYTVLIEKIWGKERIMEVYLNVVETGKGLYGIEAAARTYYDIPAARLNQNQSALIVACLPSPLTRKPVNRTRYMSGRQHDIVALMPKLTYPDWVYHKDSKSKDSKK